MAFRDELRIAREMIGTKQKDVADHAGISVGYYSDIEAGRRPVPMSKLELLVEAVGGGPELLGKARAELEDKLRAKPAPAFSFTAEAGSNGPVGVGDISFSAGGVQALHPEPLLDKMASQMDEVLMLLRRKSDNELQLEVDRLNALVEKLTKQNESLAAAVEENADEVDRLQEKLSLAAPEEKPAKPKRRMPSLIPTPKAQP